MPYTRRIQVYALALAVALLLACQVAPPTEGPETPPATPTETVEARAQVVSSTPAPSPTPTATPALPATPSPTPTPELPDEGPLPAIWTEIDFGIQGGVYHPGDLAFDAASGLVYALGTCELYSLYENEPPRTCVAVFDTANDRVLPMEAETLPAGYEGRLVLAGDTLYLHRPWVGELYALDRERNVHRTRGTIAVRETFSDVLAIAFDGDETTYAVTLEGMARLEPDPTVRPFEPFEKTVSDSPTDMVATAERIYVLGHESLWVFDTDLALVTVVDVKDTWPRVLALDEGRGRLYVGCTTGLYVLDTETNELTKAPPALSQIQDLALDATGNRLFAITYRPADWFGGTNVVAVNVADWRNVPHKRDGLVAARGKTETLFSTLSGQLRDLIFDQARNRLLVASYDDHALIPIDLASGAITPRLPLGIQVMEAIVVEDHRPMDEPGGRLYVSDSAGWIHVLDRQTYDEIGRAYGGQQISLDATHNRLYAGDPRLPVVTVLNAETLAVEQTIPQSGKPRANPATGEVVIVNRRFYVFDGASGEPRGELLPGIGRPPDECPGCYYTIATEVVIDARRGLTATTTYTPWPGKPGPRESIDYDPVSGRAYYSLLTGGYVHFSSIATYPDLGQLQRNVRRTYGAKAQPTLYLEGLSGYVKLDVPARRLYVARADRLYVLDSETLNRIGQVHTAGWTPIIAAVDGAGRLYTPLGSRLVVWTRTGGAPPAPLPPEPAVVTKTVTSILPSPNFANDQTLLATIDGRLCRSTDGGRTWQRLRGGLPEFEGYYYATHAVFSPDYANDRTLFAGIVLGDTHGEGVYRSTDGGDTWQLSSSGLYDLRVTRIVPSPAFARDRTLLAYARTQRGEAVYRSTDGGDNWQLVMRQTGYGTPPVPRPEELFFTGDQRSHKAEHLPRFECDYQGVCRRSDDGGETWTDFGTGAVQLEWLVEYALSPHYARDHTTYFLTQNYLYRYQEDSQRNVHRTFGAWSICTLPIFGERDYTRYLTSLATAATSASEHALFIGSTDGEFYRFAAAELPWQEVRPTPAATREPPTPTPCVSPIDERLETSYDRLPTRLGCASQEAVGTLVAFQPFELGQMFWRQDTREIYVLRNVHRTDGQYDATWAGYEDTWEESQPDHDPNLAPPTGLYQPMRGFGKVWREQLGGADAWIGWATDTEHSFDTAIQVFDYGLVLEGENRMLYVLYNDGTWETIDY